jgi:haloalkane dehalogenase
LNGHSSQEKTPYHMEYLRTPEEHFKNLEGYPFSPHYVTVGDGLRMHYVDEGEGEVVLLLHGEPSWSYLYRKMIPVLVEAGYRVLVPDLIGFGKSDKPVNRRDYTYAKHLEWLGSWMEHLDLRGIHLFCQDWGGLLGLRLAVEMEGRFERIVAANTILPTGDVPPNEAFMKWKAYSQNVPEFPVGKIINRGTVSELSEAVLRAYDAPFPDERYKEGAREFPAIVPHRPDDAQSTPNRAAWERLMQWKKPFLTLFSDSDPIMKGLERVFQSTVPGCQGQPHEIIEGGGHFLQEDKGEEIAGKVVAWLKR